MQKEKKEYIEKRKAEGAVNREENQTKDNRETLFVRNIGWDTT